MNFKLALIVCLAAHAHALDNATAKTVHNPQCKPPNGDVYKERNDVQFLFFVDRTLEEALLSRLYYLFKAISCEIPLSKKITVAVSKYGGSENDLRKGLNSAEVPEYLSGERIDEEGGCTAFGNTLRRSLEGEPFSKTFQFIVPTFSAAEHECYVNTFQKTFETYANKQKIIFNGILIDSNLTQPKNGSDLVRMHISTNLTEAINLKKPLMAGSDPLVQSYSRMIRGILHLELNVSSTAQVPNTTAIQTTMLTTSTTNRPGNSTTARAETTVATLKLKSESESESTTKTFTSTSTSTSTNPGNIAKASGDVTSKGDKLSEELDIPWATTRIPGWEADFMMYVLLLLLLIWLFCLFMCLIWMFYCAKRKKDKIENEAERQRIPLLEHEMNDAPATNLASSKSGENEGVEEEEEEEAWKNITPAKYVEAPKSELESVRQPPLAARYRPVEVSEFEDGRHEEEANEAPRHGFVPAKKAAELRFE
ncbi:unnamed protein product [Caenorhabditis sp. 36 PRJEB53466]|nr:unnamed protein product [Caenorhabditis sp. 36 PRJEB53466]